MSTTYTNPYENIPQLLGHNPHRMHVPFERLDAIAESLKKLNTEREQRKGLTREQGLAVKNRVFEMVRAIDKAKPAELTAFYLLTQPAGVECALGEQINAIEHYQLKLLFDKNVNAATKAECEAQVRALGDKIIEFREALMPKAPRLDRKRPNVFEDLKIERYAQFVRAFAASAEADRKNPSAAKELARLTHIDRVAKEAQGFVAMLDYVKDVEGVIKLCQSQHTMSPQTYMSHHRETIQRTLDAAVERFNTRIASLHPKVDAGTPGYTDMQAYLACIAAEKSLAQAAKTNNFGAIRRTHGALKHAALDFILGGTPELDASGKPREDEHHHKFISRVRRAYRTDQKQTVPALAATHQQDHIRAVDAGRMAPPPFNDPLSATQLHTLNRVYEARWALAADEMVKLVGHSRELGAGEESGRGDFTLTLANPEIMAPALRPPVTTDEGPVRRVPRPRKKPADDANVPPAKQVSGVVAHGMIRGGHGHSGRSQ